MKVPLLDIKQQNQLLRKQFEAAIGRVLDTNAFILGDEVEALESELADFCQVKTAIACASGSDALLLAMMALGVGQDDEVITTPFSFFATASAIARLGAKPVFADINPDTFNIEPDDLESKISPRTKAIEPVHLYGQCAEMDKIMEIAESNKIAVIEDAAQAIGALYKGKQAGSIGHIGCFSFYPSKNLGGMGDGGFMTTNDPETAARLKSLRVHGARERYFHDYIGINSRLDGFQGAVIRTKLPYLNDWTNRRRQNAETYQRLFNEAGLSERIKTPVEIECNFHIYNQFVIRVPALRDRLRAYLAENEIGTDIYYPIPLHLQKCFEYLGYREGDLPESERAAKEVLALPVYPELTNSQIEYVVSKITEFFKMKA